MSPKPRWSNLLLSGLLLVGLVGLLLAYLIVVNTLPGRIYTRSQQEFLDYNKQRWVSQAPPIMNLLEIRGSRDRAGKIPVEGGILAEGEEVSIQPANFSAWENRIQATLLGRYEEQDGVSVTVYDLDFQSEYHFQYPTTGPATTLELIFPFPNNLETLHEVSFLVDGDEPPDAQYTPQNIRWTTVVTPGDEHDIAINYKADGAGSFSYGLNRDRRTDLLAVTIAVKGLQGNEVSTYSLPPTVVEPTQEGGETFTWDYVNLVANRDIRLTLPRRLSFAQRVAELQDDFVALGALAPIFVALFLAALAGLLRIDGVRLGLPAYLLMGVGLVLFYPLLTFLSGLVNVLVAAVLAMGVVSLLLFVFLGFTAGWRAADWRLIWLLLIFLGVLSLGMLTPWRGLLLTVGGLLLVGTFMLAYARRPTGPEPELKAELAPPPITVTAETTPIRVYCPQCGRGQAADYDFCPSCGYDGRTIRRCQACGHEQAVPLDEAPIYCLHCGQILD